MMRLGELAVVLEKITEDQLREALERQKRHGGKLGHNLVSLGFIKDDDLGALLSAQYGVPAVNVSDLDVDPAIIRLIPAATARKYQIVPLTIWEDNAAAAPSFSSQER